jgi:hypothetical protein
MKDEKSFCRPDPVSKWEGRRHRGERVSEVQAQRVRGYAFSALAPGRRATSNLYRDPHIVRKGTRIGPVSESYLVEQDCILCFADHEPRAAFAHECSYYLHDVRTGEVSQRIAAEFPPYPMESLSQLEPFHRPIAPAKAFPLPPRGPGGFEARMDRVLSDSAPAGNRHAILLAGEIDLFHFNDLELAYRTLIGTFHFDPANVHVLFHHGDEQGWPFFLDDGVTPRLWPGDNSAFTMRVKGSGTREAFGAALNAIGTVLGPNDLLFIHTAGHGGTSYAGGGQYMRLRPTGSDRYYSFEMRDDIKNKLGGPGTTCRSLLVLMNQCFAGGFNANLLAAGSVKAQNTYFAAACSAADRAHATDDENWSEFTLNWYQAEMQSRINAELYMPGTDDDGDGRVEASEAYDYCVFMNEMTQSLDTPVEGRVPSPDGSDQSPADQIVLT